MKTIGLFLLVVGVSVSTDAWDLFKRVKFKTKYNSFYNTNFQYPEFDAETRALEGKEITLEGYYVPYDFEDETSIMLSRVPYAQCFFCGGAGPESVAEVVFAQKRPDFELDELVTVTGKLKLNEKDMTRMTFIIENAKLK